MVLLPLASWLPPTVMDAEEVPPEPESAALPSVAPPRVKATEPPGDDVPAAAFTVAVITVLPVEAMLDGLALTVVVVAVADTVTVTEVVPVDPPNPPLPA